MTIIKFQVANETIQSSSSAFMTNFYLFVMMPFQSTNDTTKNGTFNRLFMGYFKALIQYHIVNSVRCPLNRGF